MTELREALESVDPCPRCGALPCDWVNNPHTAAVEAEALEAKQLLDALRDESWDLRCFPVPTGGDDADIGWRVIGHWMAKPHERTVAEVYHDDPRDAIREALRARSGMLSAEKEVG